MSGKYASATNDVQRAAHVAAANYPSAVLTSRLEVVYSIVVLSLGILITGAVVLKGVFGRSTAYLALATGILGIASIMGFSAAIIMAAVLTTVWVLLVGYKLYRLGCSTT